MVLDMVCSFCIFCSGFCIFFLFSVLLYFVLFSVQYCCIYNAFPMILDMVCILCISVLFSVFSFNFLFSVPFSVMFLLNIVVYAMLFQGFAQMAISMSPTSVPIPIWTRNYKGSGGILKTVWFFIFITFWRFLICFFDRCNKGLRRGNLPCAFYY